ncbi:type IV pilus assembly protein PilM, partial [Candidatus Omnitrophota bacterium]
MKNLLIHPLLNNAKNNIFDIANRIPSFGSFEQEREEVIGLDIGSSSIKLVVLEAERSKSKLLKASYKALDGQSVSSVIKKMFEESRIESNQVNVSLSGQGVVTRCIQMPRMPITEVSKALNFEAEKYIPFPISEVTLDCCILEELPESKILVLFAAAKKAMIDQTLTQLKEAGLEVSLVDVDALALTNSFNRVFSSQESMKSDDLDGPVAVLNIGASFCSLNILQNGLPRFMRDIFAGGTDITKRISNILGISFTEAEKLKSNPQEKTEQISSASDSIFSNLANEIRLSFDYYETQGNPALQALYVSGG